MITCTFRKDHRFSVQKILTMIHATSRFESELYILNGEKSYNLKSVLGVMNLFFTTASGQILSISAEGPDAEEAVRTLSVLVEKTEQ
ncbi:HPr family phosphocarrier protein [Alteribacter natronophilus]|uniref:HPr family phosphocarrier protein n=1 Tax=Alteribacter natronophilus TaxID=2583810 RepID=UPI00110DE8F8|nr:HPr family phosphocarrier protein [Alteribacter natronophilus]TMW73392.1 HPr family phosphocarrier protein [Alteribacter natronophilus]